MRYRVTWEIDVESENPEGAALEAFAVMIADKTAADSATVFRVVDENGNDHGDIDVARVESE